MSDEVQVILVVGMLFIGLPWIIFHYITRWKTAATLTTQDEDLLDELHELAGRLDDRMCTIERIMAAENPNWRSMACAAPEAAIEDQREPRFETARSGEPRFETTRSNQPTRRIR